MSAEKKAQRNANKRMNRMRSNCLGEATGMDVETPALAFAGMFFFSKMVQYYSDHFYRINCWYYSDHFRYCAAAKWNSNQSVCVNIGLCNTRCRYTYLYFLFVHRSHINYLKVIFIIVFLWSRCVSWGIEEIKRPQKICWSVKPW